MAQRIEGGTLPPIKQARKRETGREKYPWTEWFDGELWRLARGQDFDVRVESFRTAALAAAERHGVTVGTRRVNDSVVLLKVTGFTRKPEAQVRGRKKAEKVEAVETTTDNGKPEKRRFRLFR